MIGENIFTTIAIAPIVRSNNETATGTIINIQGYKTGAFIIATGAASGSPTAISVAYKLQTGDAANGSDMADVAGTSGTITEASTSAELNVNTSALKKYVRVVCTVSLTGGSSPSIPVTAIACLEGKYLPV